MRSRTHTCCRQANAHITWFMSIVLLLFNFHTNIYISWCRKEEKSSNTNLLKEIIKKQNLAIFLLKIIGYILFRKELIVQILLASRTAIQQYFWNKKKKKKENTFSTWILFGLRIILNVNCNVNLIHFNSAFSLHIY